MYKLIEFLRRIYVVVLFVVFEAIAIGYYAHSSNYTQAKLLTRSNQVVGGVNGVFADIRSYFTLGRENERLLGRVAALEEELAFTGDRRPIRRARLCCTIWGRSPTS